MLARPRARNASAASPRVSLNLTPRPKPLPSPTPEPESAPEVESESPRKSEIDTVNAALRSVLVEMHERDAARRECSQVLDAIILEVEQNVEKEAARAYRDNLEIKNVVNDLIEATETRAADLVAIQCAVASQISAEMESKLVEEELQRCAHECWTSL